MVLVAHEFWVVRTEGLLPPAVALPTLLTWIIRIVLGVQSAPGPGPRRPHEADRSKIDPGFQLACPSELKVILKAIATISVWVCVCLFVAPV